MPENNPPWIDDLERLRQEQNPKKYPPKPKYDPREQPTIPEHPLPKPEIPVEKNDRGVTEINF